MINVPYCRFLWSQERVMIRNRLATFPISLLLIATTCLVPWNASQAAWTQQTAKKTNESAQSQTPASSPNQGSVQTKQPVKSVSDGSNDPTPAPAGAEPSPSLEGQGQAGQEGEMASSPEAAEGQAAEETLTSGDSDKVDSGTPLAADEGAPSNPDSALPPPELQPNLALDEPMVGKRSATGKGLLIAGISAAGLGLAMLGTSIGITQCNYDGPLQCKYATQRSLFIPTSLAVTLAGAVLVGAGLGFRARYKKWEQGRDKAPPKKTALVPAYLRGGAALIYTTEF